MSDRDSERARRADELDRGLAALLAYPGDGEVPVVAGRVRSIALTCERACRASGIPLHHLCRLPWWVVKELAGED
jgi:hypothetical protein